MKVLLNLITPDPGIDKSIVADWVFRFFARHKTGTCTVITEEPLPVDFPNVEQVSLKPPHNKPAFSAWKRFKLIPLLRMQNSDVLITWDSMKTGISKKQVLVISPGDASFFSNKQQKKSRIRALERKETGDLHIIVFSEKERNRIAGNYPSFEKNIQVIYRIPQPVNTAIDWQEKESVLSQYSGGNEFFLTPPCISMDQMRMLLKSYSGFKKWQKSSMQLLVSFNSEDEEKEVNNLLKNYRFRDSIKLVSSMDDAYSKLLSAAYAVILPDEFDSNFDFLFACMQACAPVLIPERSIYSEVMGEAGLHLGFNDQETLTKKLLQVFRDEVLRNRVMQMQKGLLKKFASYDPSEKLFQSVRS